MTRLFSLIFVALTAMLPSFGHAGSSEAGKSILPTAEVAAFSNRVQQDLASRGVHVAIVARMGRDPKVLPPGIKYTHVSFWVFSQITRPDGSTGRGYQAYNLYQDAGNKTRSNLIQDSPADFFAGAHMLDAGIIIPDVRLQKKLLNVIASPTYSTLHNAQYSVLANPNTSQFQNCTEHTLDVLMASLYGTKNVPQIKANIAAHFQPQEIQIGGMKRLLAPAASQALTTSDHGTKVETATFGSIARFMDKNDLSSQVYRITPDKVIRF
ncbi:DUF2145 domain-containing protein [Parasedimentitalea huanghaiensis]|uniref:DUF2145 domain-containing protein n=1 Tax=Parasedimentitalea huanghaiensis TaxID=2682100 RepID=A0A6L6WI91_9RHOB|nr:DUF2145 domain-containing protein [Zongyanglinia huanghaiensis]MVO17513.1 DUF2145 domain-containing protein [Zongyanglinia huanghaiensis]